VWFLVAAAAARSDAMPPRARNTDFPWLDAYSTAFMPLVLCCPNLKRAQRQCSLRLLLVVLLLASCAAAPPANDDVDDEWGIFTVLRNAQSAGGTSHEQCSCCQEVQDLRARVAALERDVARITAQVSKPSTASHCPSAPTFADASAAADSAVPALARLQLAYCREWVRFRNINPPRFPAHCQSLH
jgi:hypothetical protein